MLGDLLRETREQKKLSLEDVDLGSRKSYLTTDNDSWFVSEDDYEEISQIALYL